MFRKNVIDYKNPEMLKFISQNGRTLSLKKQTNQSEKNLFKINKNKNNLINLKLDPQNIEQKEPIKNIGIFEVKIHIHPMLDTPTNTSQN